jgi:hypothetical protein
MRTSLSLLLAAATLCAGSWIVFAGNGQTSATAQRPLERFEVSSIRAVRPTLERTISALEKQDIAGARAAFEAYDGGWNGIEMYINRRYPAIYTELERNYQDKIAKGLNETNPNFGALTSDTRAMLAKYDETIRMIEQAPPLSPLYDDVAHLRIVRVNLLPLSPALKAGDLARFRKSFDAFHHTWEEIEGMVAERSHENFEVIEESVHAVEAALRQDKPNIDQLTKIVSDMTLKYDLVLAEVYKQAQSTK